MSSNMYSPSNPIDVSWTNYGLEENNTIIYCEKGAVKIDYDPHNNVIVETNDGQTMLYRLGKI